jgi:hypothetical protein
MQPSNYFIIISGVGMSQGQLLFDGMDLDEDFAWSSNSLLKGFVANVKGNMLDLKESVCKL